MSIVTDFNRIEECDKIDAECIDAFLDYTYDPDNAPTTLCVESSWGGGCIDLEPLVKAAESCTSLYLSPEENPNCLVYEKEERCGDNDCIHGDDLSRIISMRYLKDVRQTTPTDGIVYMYDNQTDLFEPYDLKTTIGNINTAITNINAAITNLRNRVTDLETLTQNHESRLQIIEEKLTPPTGTPNGAKVVFGNINLYSDHNAVIKSSGVATTLDKTHGLYTHNLNETVLDDEIMG